MTHSGTIYKQLDVVLLPFPYSDLSGAKQRPALIISNTKLKNDYICLLVTSQPNAGIPLKLKKGKLAFPSWVKPHRIFTVHPQIIRKKVGTISKESYIDIVQELNSYIQA